MPTSCYNLNSGVLRIRVQPAAWSRLEPLGGLGRRRCLVSWPTSSWIIMYPEVAFAENVPGVIMWRVVAVRLRCPFYAPTTITVTPIRVPLPSS